MSAVSHTNSVCEPMSFLNVFLDFDIQKYLKCDKCYSATLCFNFEESENDDAFTLDFVTNQACKQYVILFRYGVAVQDFTSSWRSGLAFLAVIKAIDCTLVDMKHALEKSARENLEDAFSIAQNKLGVPRLLEPEGKHISFVG